MPPVPGPAAQHPYGPGGRIPDRPSWKGLPLSFLWAFSPLYSCGLATPFIIGYAAARLRNRRLWWATAAYGAALIAYFVAANVWNSGDPNRTDPRVDAAAGAWVVIGMVGGVAHALFLRVRIFQPRRSLPPEAMIPYGRPVTTPAAGGYPPPGAAPASPYGMAGRASASPPPGAGGRVPASPWPSVQQETPGQPGTPEQVWTPEPAGRRSEPLGRFGPYTLTRKLGEGGQGVVYLGQGPDGQPVAVKMLHARIAGHAAERDGFIREARAARRVPGYATARVIDAGVVGDQPYIVSEYVHGPSLERLVRDERPRNGDSLTRLAIATAAALQGIHSAGIVHRDLKPANVLIGPDGPRVIDFGMAKALDQVTRTFSGLRGTPAYMSPEQVSSLPVGPPSDVFSWASTIFYAATGDLAFGGSTLPEVVYRITNVRPDLLAVPPALRAPLTACFDREPANRPTAADLMVALSR